MHLPTRLVFSRDLPSPQIHRSVDNRQTTREVHIISCLLLLQIPRESVGWRFSKNTADNNAFLIPEKKARNVHKKKLFFKVLSIKHTSRFHQHLMWSQCLYFFSLLLEAFNLPGLSTFKQPLSQLVIKDAFLAQEKACYKSLSTQQI